MPREPHDPHGFSRPAFRLEEKWLKKIATMPAKPDGSRFVKIHLKNGSYQNYPVVNGEIAVHVLFRDEDIIDISLA